MPKIHDGRLGKGGYDGQRSDFPDMFHRQGDFQISDTGEQQLVRNTRRIDRGPHCRPREAARGCRYQRVDFLYYQIKASVCLVMFHSLRP